MALVTVLRGLAALSWLGLIGAIVYVVGRAARGQRTKGRVLLVVAVLVVAVLLNVLSAGLVYVESYEMGVVKTIASGGVRPEPLEPGLNWIIPFAESAETYTFSDETYTMSVDTSQGTNVYGDLPVVARTSDGQEVTIDASVIFKINPARVVQDIHIRWRGLYMERFVMPEVRGIIRDAVSKYGVEEVYSIHRQELTDLVREDLFSTLDGAGLILQSFVLRNISFTPEYAAVIESKQIAEQRVLEEEFVVQQREQQAKQAVKTAEGEAQSVVKRAEGNAEALIIQAEAEAQARLIKAQAEAQALQLLGQAIAAYPDVLTLEYIMKLAPNITVMLLPSNNPFLFPLPDLGP